jgi:hypothetical protein
VDYTVRHLETIDFFRVAKIIKACTSATRQTLLDAFSAPKKAPTPISGEVADEVATAPPEPANNLTELGFALFEALIDQERDVKEFFAGLVNMKPADFDHTPYDTMLYILERVKEQDDLPAFLARVVGLATRLG